MGARVLSVSVADLGDLRARSSLGAGLRAGLSGQVSEPEQPAYWDTRPDDRGHE